MDATERMCIICRNLKHNFNEEHTIPKTIGGGLKIHSVCYECNKTMGDNIDTPFVNLYQILSHRHKYNLKRGQRNIKYPLSGRHTTSEGDTIVIQNNRDGLFYDFVPKMQIIQTTNGPIGKLTSSDKFLGPEEDMIRKYSKEFENKTGFTVGTYKVERNNDSNPVTITVTDSNNDFIFGCIKIAYETAVTCIPNYYSDELAIVYSKMLETGILDRSYKEYLNPNLLFLEELLNDSAINNFHCVIAIGNVETIGLIASIRIFDMKYSLILSKKDDYIDDRIILFLNDSLKRSIYQSIIKNISTFELFFNNNSLSVNHWAEIETYRHIVSEIFLNEKKEVPLYNKEGERIAEHIISLYITSKWNISLEALSTVQKFHLALSDGFFIKSVKTNLLYELAVINFNY